MKKATPKSSSAAPTLGNCVNHIYFVLDASLSMRDIRADVIKVYDSQIDYLVRRSKELDQETRVSVYMFSDRARIACLVYDKDVLRVPRIDSQYVVGGNTALLDATGKAITDAKQTPELYGDHAHLMYVITDGEENNSMSYTTSRLKTLIAELPDNWTLATLVPDIHGVAAAKQCGFAPNNISIWSTTAKGVAEMGNTVEKATEGFLRNRALGIRRSNTLFSLDTTGLTKRAVKANLDVLPTAAYYVVPVTNRDGGASIRDFVERKTKKPYRAGSAFYQLTKKETIQASKEICLKDADGKVYTGDFARDMVGLPAYNVDVSPADHKQFSFFVQSTSHNRKLVAGTELLVLN